MSKYKVALLGVGLMGERMAGRLLARGTQLGLYNRSAEKTRALAAGGARVFDTPAGAVEWADASILMLSDAQAIREVLLAAPVRDRLNGHAVIQMGTIAPDESREIAAEVKACGGSYLEAPVLGSLPEAEAGTLLVMVGSDTAQYEHWAPLLEELAGKLEYIGEVGKAAAMKLAFNQLIAALTSAFALSLGLVRHEAVPVERFMGLLRASALYAPTFDKKLERMLSGDFDNAHFPLKHLLKDVDLFLQAAAPHGLDDAVLAGVRDILGRGVADGLGECDYSALCREIDPA
ncbi:MAG: NAD(P)-dependent oxidoreductase [Gammaproteobacteria bacterium]